MQDNYLNILESIKGLLVIDTDENVVFMCKDLIETTGYSNLKEVEGKNIRSLLRDKTNEAVKKRSHLISGFYMAEDHGIVPAMFPIKDGGNTIGASMYDLSQLHDEIYSLYNIKGSSSSIKKIKNEILIAAASNSNVLITGDAGTGKKLIARSIHQLSRRALFNLVEVNCAAVSEELFETKLFGYEEASFAARKEDVKKGLAGAADKGTLFLNEIDALSMQMQAKLLRFIQEKEIGKMPGRNKIPADVRIIAVTNKNLPDLIEKDEFREDLYYCLHVIPIEVSPLRQRKSDIPELVNTFLEEFNNSMDRSVNKYRVKNLDTEALKLLMDYDWPGNVRELRNVIERAMNRCYEEVMRTEHFHDSLNLNKQETCYEEIIGSVTLEEMKNRMEIRVIKNILSKEGSTITKAAEQLGISRQMLHRKIKKYGIT